MRKRKPIQFNGKVYEWKDCECGNPYVGIRSDKDHCSKTCASRYGMREKRAKEKAKKIKKELTLKSNKNKVEKVKHERLSEFVKDRSI